MASKIRVVAVLMGLGHMRAGFPLRDLSTRISLFTAVSRTPAEKNTGDGKKSGICTISCPGLAESR